MLAALARRAGAAVLSVAHAGDDPAATRDAFAAALEGADLVVASGGVSVGPHDHVKPALEALGVQEVFWRVALRPGKPTWFGTRERTLVLGLPGNPVSAMVTFLLFARPALRALVGLPGVTVRRRAVLGAAVARHPERDECVRVVVAGDGTVRPTGPQGSHVLSSLALADALAIVPMGDGELPAGAEVELEEL
jgi:molybdopterin molybdotransferase